MKIKILISLKEGVLDPQAKAISHALHSQGFNSVNDVKFSKEIILDVQESDRQKAFELAEDMCKKLLANVVIENYSIEIL